MTADLRSLLGREHFASAADAELLARYVAERDDLAFAELVHRHAPAVYAACRRFLSAPADLDDAFQAVFVLLAQKAGGIADPAKLSGWLCGAAGRIARRVRGRAARRAAVEKPLEDVPDTPAPDVAPFVDLKAVLDEELARLPAAYREVVVLCDLDGLSRRTAAERLGVPDSTLSNRLTRARAMLGTRLLRRGVALGAGLSLSTVAVASVPPKLVPLVVSRITTDAVPPNILTLAAQGTPLMPPLKIASVLLAGLLLAGVALVPLTAADPVKAPPPVARPVAPPDPEPEEGGFVSRTTFSPDGRWLAVSEMKHHDGPGDDRITLYDTTTWKAAHRIQRNGEKERAWALAFSPDGKTLYAGDTGDLIHTWDTKTGKAGPTLDAKAGGCQGLAVSRDGKLLASGHSDAKAGTSAIHLWDAATGKPLRVLKADLPVQANSIGLSPDGKTVVGGYHASHKAVNDLDGFHGVIEWDTATGKEVNRFPTPRITKGATPVVNAVAHTPDGTRLIVAGGEAVPVGPGACRCVGYLWVMDRKNGEVDRTLVADVPTDYVRNVAVSADGKRLFAATHTPPQRVMRNGQFDTVSFCVLHCWDTATWDLEWSRPGANTTSNAVAVSPDGRRVALADGQAGLFLFDGRTGEPGGGLVKLPPPK